MAVGPIDDHVNRPVYRPLDAGCRRIDDLKFLRPFHHHSPIGGRPIYKFLYSETTLPHLHVHFVSDIFLCIVKDITDIGL